MVPTNNMTSDDKVNGGEVTCGSRMKHIYLWLLVIMIVAVSLRFYNITETGILIWDEGIYITEGQFIVTSVPYLINNFPRYDISSAEARIQGTPPMWVKPGHALLVALAMFLFGIHDYSGIILSASLGVFSVVMVFLLGRWMYDEGVGSIAASVLAVSGYHIMFSRSAYAEIDSGFFFILAIYFYYADRKNSNRHNLILSGLMVGVGFICNPRLFLAPFLFLIYEVHFWVSERCVNPSKKIKRFLVLFGFMLVPILFAEIPYSLGVMLTDSTGRAFPIPTYFEQLNGRLLLGTSRGFDFSDILYDPPVNYLYFLWRLEGVIVCVLLLVGLYRILRRPSFEDLITGSWFIVPLLFYTFFSTPRTRYISIFIPAIALVSARAFRCTEMHWPNSSRKIIPVIIPIILLFGIWNSIPLLDQKSGWKDAINWLGEHSVKKHLSTMPTISKFYVGRNSTRFPDRTMERVRKRCKEEGYCFALIDRQYKIAFNMSRSTSRWKSKSIWEIERLCNPVYVSEHRFNILQYCFQRDRGSFSTTYNIYKNSMKDELGGIRVYDLKECLGIP